MKARRHLTSFEEFLLSFGAAFAAFQCILTAVVGIAAVLFFVRGSRMLLVLIMTPVGALYAMGTAVLFRRVLELSQDAQARESARIRENEDAQVSEV